ncbi:MAG TPA: IPT/TIG domain-containing protein, partial [Pseudomonadota bacterium]|nr:IPT/TIG domain-containing protein [Pseudomonadota bacterium]
MRISFASLLTGTLLWGATACDNRPLVVVEAAPLPADAAELYVSLSYRGHPARKPAPIRFNLSGQRLDEPATFGVRLESQTDGDLVVGAGVFDSGGCLSAFGSAIADRVSATPRLALTLGPAPVELLPHAERCQMPELTPLLLSISPARASTAGGERAVLRGWGFGTDNCSLVSINGTKVTDMVCRSLVELAATIPPSSKVGPAQVQVVNPSSSGDRQVISATLFSYYAESIRLGMPTAYPVDAGPVALVSGRIDRDQRPDLVVVSREVGTVTILINSGLGLFPSGFRTALPAGVRPTAVGLGD